ncbi:MAG: SufBD protein [Thermoplasmata archaeon]|nr:MAG: SufBD protein [Thermoplasmata archaeon]RLF53238.1 MAG: SufBD protein [Thermoplasmata archaeon]
MDINELLKLAEEDKALMDKDTAHLTINLNKVVSKNIVPGLHVDTKELKDSVEVKIKVDDGVVIEKKVHLCFGVTHEKALQKIKMDIDIGKNASISVLSHCIFPKAVDVKHIMDAKINVGENASYTYEEKHIHSVDGGIEVYPKADVKLDKKAKFKTTFELVEGRVGKLDINYSVTGLKESVMELMSKVSGRGDDIIKIKEGGNLIGEKARGVLTSRVAVRDNAKAEVYNIIKATAPYARGHVDCKEIIQGNGVATAIPVVEVKHPKAHVTHEAAIGSVNSKQLQTLMARGLSEDDATDLIIEGLLS